MIGFIILYLTCKTYYELAQINDKGNLWGYAILGVVAYYASFFLGGILLAVGLSIFVPNFFEGLSEKALTALSLPFAFLGCWGVYVFLKKRWNQEYEEPISDATLLDDNI